MRVALQRKGREPKTMPLRSKLRKTLKRGLNKFGYPTTKLKNTNATLVLFYHNVGDEGTPLDAFEQQIDYLQANFELIFASDIGKPSPSGTLRVAITFDDGLRNTREVALPILEKFGVKSTLFVLPCDIHWLWPAEVRERLTTAQKSGLDLGDLVLKDNDDIDHIVQEMKAMPCDAFKVRLKKIRETTPFAPSSTWLSTHELMSAEELRALPGDLIEFGAHTIHHPILPSLDQRELDHEIVQSKQQLETLLGRPIRTFSYPNGDFDQRCLDLVEQHYDFAFTTESAIGAFPDQASIRGHRYAINRLHGVDYQTDLPLAMYQFINQGHGFEAIDDEKANQDRQADNRSKLMSPENALTTEGE